MHRIPDPDPQHSKGLFLVLKKKLEEECVGAELEAEGGGEPELVEQLSGQLNSQATAQNIEKLFL
jgi:hypothetical protein